MLYNYLLIESLSMTKQAENTKDATEILFKKKCSEYHGQKRNVIKTFLEEQTIKGRLSAESGKDKQNL